MNEWVKQDGLGDLLDLNLELSTQLIADRIQT